MENCTKTEYLTIKLAIEADCFMNIIFYYIYADALL